MKSKPPQPIQPAEQDPQDPEFSLLVPEKKQAISAIKKLKFRTTPAELAVASGLSINQAAYWLNKIASETRGQLEVTNDGTVFYSYAENFTQAYLQRGMRKTALLVGSALFKVLYWVMRVSFGVALVLSILVIIVLFTLIIIAAISAMFGDSDGGGGGDISLPTFDTTFLFDIFRFDYSPSHTYYSNSLPSKRRDKYKTFVDTHPKGNFFLECFSFLFGDGKPNSNLQEVRWQHVARMIKQNGGVVSNEQLAPFLDGDKSDSGMILGALAQLNGRPEVTQTGNIVYVFPDFLSEMPSLPGRNEEKYLVEDTWKFSAFPTEAITKVFVLATLNFAGSWWLFKHIATIHLLSGLAVLIDVLLTYATVFLLIPAVRYAGILVLNERIRQRNEKRRAAYDHVSNDRTALAEIKEANLIRKQELEKVISDKRIIYTTERDALEQQFEGPH